MSKLPLALTAAFALSLPAGADPLLKMMRAQSADGPLYAYEMTYTEEGLTATGKVDPSAEIGQRIEVYTPAREDWTEDFEDGLKEMDAETKGDIWCADFAETVPTSAARITETDTDATFSFTPVPEDGADNTEKKLMKKIEGKITLAKDDGAVTAFSMRLPKPYKPAMIAKINVFDMQASCARAPDGRTYIETFSMNISGSAMMQAFEESVNRKITRLLGPVGE